MKDISNTYHLRNNKPSKSRRVPSGPLTMSLRSKHKPQRMIYDTLCKPIARKTHSNARYDHDNKQNRKRTVSVRDEDTTTHDTNTRPKKKRKKRRRKWGNSCKQKNKHREKKKDQKNAIKQEIYRNYVSKMNNKIKALNEKKMNWSDYRLLKKYECIKLFNNASNILERVKALKKARNQHRTAPRV
eukprot:25958_1